MFDKKKYYSDLKKAVVDAEKAYDNALDKLEVTFSHINKCIIHGKKEQGSINTLKAVISSFNQASFKLELANHNLSSFLKHGVVKYE